MSQSRQSSSTLFDRTTAAFAAAALAAAVACLYLRGFEGVARALGATGVLVLEVAPQVIGGLLIAGLAQVLIPRETVSRWLGEEAGMRGLVIAEVAGALTPGGPFGSFPMVYALAKVGADIGVLVCYLTSWTTLGLLRVLVWELPFLGYQFALLRFVICIPMGIAAGLMARWLARRWGWRTQDIVP